MKTMLCNVSKLLLTLFLLSCFSLCKKDYPDDTPVWLKKKIREIKRGDEKDSINVTHISEYKKNETFTYVVYFSNNITPNPRYEIYFYNSNGDFLCERGAGGLYDPLICLYWGDVITCMDSCGGELLQGFQLIRIIWESNYNNK